MAAADYEPRICATEVESLIFNEQKTAIGFKAAVLRKVNEIKAQTAARELSQNLIPPDIVGSIFDENSSDNCKDNGENKESSESKESGENVQNAYKKPTFADSLFEKASSLLARSQNPKPEVKALSDDRIDQNERFKSQSGILEPSEVATENVGPASPINVEVTLNSEDLTDSNELHSTDSPADFETSKKPKKDVCNSDVLGTNHFDLDKNSETKYPRKRNHFELK